MAQTTLQTLMLVHADPTQVAGLARFFKTGPGQYGEGDKFLGIKVPVTRAVVRECWRQTSFDDLEECLTSEYHELRLAALLTLVEIFRHAKRCPVAAGHDGKTGQKGAAGQGNAVTPDHPDVTPDLIGGLQERCIQFYLSHTDYINNWDLVDLSCYPLLDKDRSLLYDLARNGKTLWEQRIGIVSTMTFIRHGQLADTFAIADILLHHPHDLIHKAVGWLLREAGKRDKPALEAYLQGYETPGQAGGDVIPNHTVMPGSDRSVMPGSDRSVMPGSDRASLPRYLVMPRTALRNPTSPAMPTEHHPFEPFLPDAARGNPNPAGKYPAYTPYPPRRPAPHRSDSR